jgi:formamidopyrimidine-DNA glycosylase
LPELPEVETIARGLQAAIAGKEIASARVLRDKVVAPAPARFVRLLRGERVESVGRRGKYVVMNLASGRSLVTHLRMTGRLIVQKGPRPALEPYTNVLLNFRDGSRLAFADVRQFGRMRLVEPEEPWAAEVGIEPLSPEFSVERFRALLEGRKTPIKVFLLDQRHIAGLGNIYVCETLWEARIHPGTPAGSISRPAGRRLHQAIVNVLRRAIAFRGTSVDDYVDADGLRGGFQNQLSVYGRNEQKCPRCGRRIVRTVIAQRGTWWCPGCQRLKKNARAPRAPLN